MGICIGHQIALNLLRGCCPPGSLVVDAGAFPGGLTRLLRKEGWKVLALDKEPDRGLSLQRRFLAGDSLESDLPDGETTFSEAMQQIDVEVRAVDLESSAYPVESESADAIILTEVIEHLWVNPLFALTEMNRILKSNAGVLVISTPNLLSIRNRFNFFRGRIGRVIEHPFVVFLKKSRLGHLGHLRLYAPSELDSILRLLGFEPSFHFYSFNDMEYGDDIPNEPQRKGGAGHELGNSVSTGPYPAARRSFLRKLFRSPKGYIDAGVATIRALLERTVPSFRQHIFVVAKKVRRADFREISLNEVNSAIANRASLGEWENNSANANDLVPSRPS